VRFLVITNKSSFDVFFTTFSNPRIEFKPFFVIILESAEENAKQITNRNLLERLNRKVVEYKAESIANTIIYGMTEEMNILVLFSVV
jgi:hypothetical protein